MIATSSEMAGVISELVKTADELRCAAVRIEELEAQRDQAVEALKPFAVLAEVMRRRGYESYVRVARYGYDDRNIQIKAGDYYRAEAAIAATEDE